MPDVHFTTAGIEKLLLNLNPSKAAGPDLLPTRILKMIAKESAPIIQVIFQQPYNNHEVPEDWKNANITAVYKKGDKTSPSNYVNLYPQ